MRSRTMQRIKKEEDASGKGVPGNNTTVVETSENLRTIQVEVGVASRSSFRLSLYLRDPFRYSARRICCCEYERWMVDSELTHAFHSRLLATSERIISQLRIRQRSILRRW